MMNSSFGMKIAFLAVVCLVVTSCVSVGTLSLANAEIKLADISGAKNMKVVKDGNDVYMVFQAINKSASGRQDIYLTSSHDGGKHYTTINLSNGKLILNASEGNETTDVESSFNPQIAVDNESEVYVVWNAKSPGNPGFVVLDISKDKFATPVIPFVNMTNQNVPGSDLSLIKDEASGAVNLYYLTPGEGPQDPCKTRCG